MGIELDRASPGNDHVRVGGGRVGDGCTHHASLTYLRATTYVLGRSEVGLREAAKVTSSFTASRRTVR
jgi:hypothetical protein